MTNSSNTDWEALARMQDEEIDYSDIPPLSASFFQRVQLWRSRQKVTVTVEMDADVLEWFQTAGDNWEAKVQAALRLYVEAHKAYQ